MDQMIEATPVGIRAAYGTEFRTALIDSNVTLIPMDTLVLIFHKVVRFGKGSVAQIRVDGVWPTCNGRHEIFFSTALPLSRQLD